MAYRYWKPSIYAKGSIGIPNNKIANNKGGNRLRQLLNELHAQKEKEIYNIDPKKFAHDKYYRFQKWGSRIWHKALPKQPKYRPCLADDYQKFKKNFVDEYDGDAIQDTGMTHKEFWEYFRNGKREGVELHSEEYWNSISEEQLYRQRESNLI
jgi:hypothetical protein